MGEDENAVIDVDIHLDIKHEEENEIRNMLRKHEKMCSGQSGQINATVIGIDLVPDAEPFNSAPYVTGPKTRELDRA